jgi:hypothetical protein
MQVLKFGGFDKLNVFPLEGYFKICRSLYYGTKAIGEQILRNTAKKHQLYFLENNKHVYVTHPKLQYVYQHLMIKTYQNVSALKDITLKQLEDFEPIEQQAIALHLNVQNYEVITSTKCTISGISKISNYLK